MDTPVEPVTQRDALTDRRGFLTTYGVRLLDNIRKRLPRTGTFTLGAAVTTTVTESAVLGASVIVLMPTNAAAATLMGSAKSLYVSARTSGESFAVRTANGVAAAGTETFEYVIRQ